MADSTITVSGNITRDPDLRFFPDGTAVLNLSVAVSYRYKAASGEWVEEEPSYEDIVLRGRVAENAAASLHKGTRVIVTGRSRKRRYDKDGQTRTASEIVVDDIGISLRFATATAERNPTVGNGERRTTPATPPATRPGTGNGDGTSGTVDFGDEEPF